VRFEIVRTIRKIGDISVAPELMNYISYSDNKIRNEAVYTIGRFRYRPAVGELARLFDKESKLPAKTIDRVYCEKLLDALAFIADPSSKGLFINERSSPDSTIRLRAFEGLARIGDPGIVTEISRERLNEKDAKVQTAQAYALYRTGRREYLDALVKALTSRKTNNEARQYLVEFKPEELQELIAQTKNNDPSVREALAEILGLIGDSSAIPALQELSKDRRGQVSSLANQAMRRINARAGKS
jgi:HEAT repeat protein